MALRFGKLEDAPIVAGAPSQKARRRKRSPTW